jgi:hypothetical protein
VQMAKSDPEAQRKSSLSDCTWLENEYGTFNLKILKFLMHFREPGSSFCFYFIVTHTYIFFSFSHTYIFFALFLFLSFSFSSFFLCQQKFLFSPLLNSKIALYLHPPPCLDVCSSSGKEVIKIR